MKFWNSLLYSVPKFHFGTPLKVSTIFVTIGKGGPCFMLKMIKLIDNMLFICHNRICSDKGEIKLIFVLFRVFRC
ncbi:MAG: hypothetical protein GY795_23330 [Desulfobacterales bacterium]|nr:hypothetical protein [Desulfobacterales bacterium]